jgi:hypothetical protein
MKEERIFAIFACLAVNDIQKNSPFADASGDWCDLILPVNQQSFAQRRGRRHYRYHYYWRSAGSFAWAAL